MDKTTFEATVGASYTLIADLSENKYVKSHLMISSHPELKIEVAASPDAESPILILPHHVGTQVFNNFFPSGKLYAKSSNGNATITISVW